MDMSFRIQLGTGVTVNHFMNLAKGLSPDGNRFVAGKGKLSVCAVSERG